MATAPDASTGRPARRTLGWRDARLRTTRATRAGLAPGGARLPSLAAGLPGRVPARLRRADGASVPRPVPGAARPRRRARARPAVAAHRRRSGRDGATGKGPRDATQAV